MPRSQLLTPAVLAIPLSLASQVLFVLSMVVLLFVQLDPALSLNLVLSLFSLFNVKWSMARRNLQWLLYSILFIPNSQPDSTKRESLQCPLQGNNTPVKPSLPLSNMPSLPGDRCPMEASC